MRTLLKAAIVPLATLLLLAHLSVARAQLNFGLGLTVGECNTDDEVAANDREPYEKAAMQFVAALEGDKPQDAYAQLVDGLQKKIAVDDFVNNTNKNSRSLRPFRDLHIVHSYRESQTTTGSAMGRAVCTAVAHGPNDNPEDRVTIRTLPVALQAYVVIEGQTSNNRWAFVVGLVPNQPVWRVAGYYDSFISILDHDASDVREMARRERDADHSFNAYVLFATAKQLASRGPDLQLGILPEIDKELDALEKPPEFKDQDWKLSNGTYHVLNVGPTGAGNEIALRIRYRAAQSDDNSTLESRNQAFIKAFKEVHPEYSDAFDALAIVATRPDGTGFQSVDRPH